MSSFYHKPTSRELSCTAISTKHFKWLLEEAWDAGMQQFFIRERSKIFTPLFHTPVAYHKRHNKNKAFSARWLLTDAQGLAICWAELQHFHGSLTLVHLMLGRLTVPFPAADKALSLLLSSLFINSRCDAIKLIPSQGEPWSQIIHGLVPSAETQTLWSPVKDFAMPWTMPLRQVGDSWPAWLLFPSQWWQQSLAQQDRQSLHYLEMRKSNQAKMATLTRPTKRSLWSILFRRHDKQKTRK